MDAVAGRASDVVKPCTTIGTMAPGDSSDGLDDCTRAAEGISPAMEVSSGAGPVMVKIEVAMLRAGGVMVVVRPGWVRYWVTVVEALGRGRMREWSVLLIVSGEVVRDWARRREGVVSARPRWVIVRNIAGR